MLLVLAPVLGFGCGGGAPAATPPETPPERTTAAAASHESPAITLDLTPRNDSGQAGKAALRGSEGGVLEVTIEMSQPADYLAAHIHRGTCADYDRSGGTPIEAYLEPINDATGSVSTVEADLRGKSFSINLHEVTLGTVVACGDIPSAG